MLLSKRLLIAGAEAQISEYRLILRENAVGEGQFIVHASDALQVGASVLFLVGNSAVREGELTPVFAGVVVAASQHTDFLVRLEVREISHCLSKPCPLALRHVTADQVLGALAAQTGLEVQMLPQSQRLPFFYHAGDGISALQQVGRAFKFERFFWQMNSDGTLWAGDWQESTWAQKPLQIPAHFLKQVGSAGRMVILPALRPGAALNGARIASIFYQGDFMEIRCAS